MGAISLKYKSKSGNLTAPGDVDPGAMIPLATTTLTTTTSTVTFSSIPQGYEHLQIRCLTKSSDPNAGYDAFSFQFNGDTGSNYVAHQLAGNGTSVIASFTAPSSNMTVGYSTVSASGYANIFTSTVVDILDYANTNKYKTMRSLSGNELNTGDVNSRVRVGSGLWMNTNAISSISIFDSSTPFVQYSRFALYGIKRAGA